MPSISWEHLESALRGRLARNVRRLRRARGLSMEEAAGDLMNWRQWQRVESEEHASTVRTIAKIAFSLGVDPLELLQ